MIATRALPGRVNDALDESEAGFTLIEVTAAILIVALVASLVIATTTGTGRAGLKAVALQSAALMRHERMAAILRGHARRVALDGRARLLVGDGGEAVAIPRDVTIDVLGADAIWEGRQAVVRFDPDGGSTGAILRLSHEKVGYEIRVNWYTGAVAVASAQAQ